MHYAAAAVHHVWLNSTMRKYYDNESEKRAIDN